MVTAAVMILNPI